MKLIEIVTNTDVSNIQSSLNSIFSRKMFGWNGFIVLQISLPFNENGYEKRLCDILKHPSTYVSSDQN